MPAKTLPGFRIVLFASMAGAAQLAIAQLRLVGPTAISQPAPVLTSNAVGTPTEGWAVVRYWVLEDGTTASVRVVDIVPPGADPSATIDAVEQWTFTPGTKDGEPIDWNNNEAIVVFQSPAEDSEPSSDFQDGYTEILETIQAQIPTLDGPDPEDAIKAYEGMRDANLKLLREHATNVEDIALGLSQAMFINIYLKDSHAAYEFARRATDPRNNLLHGEDLRVALQQRLQLEATLGRIRDALITFERIDAGYGPDEPNPAAEFAEQLRDRAESDEILKTMGYVGERPWRVDASRKIFTVGEIDGAIDSIDAECDSARIRLDYQENVDWRLPDSLGACTYFVNADPGTSFSFFEMLPSEH
jgi:hypothetical protein